MKIRVQHGYRPLYVLPDLANVRAAIQAAYLAGEPRVAADIATENGLAGVCLYCAITLTRYRVTMSDPTYQLCDPCGSRMRKREP